MSEAVVTTPRGVDLKRIIHDATLHYASVEEWEKARATIVNASEIAYKSKKEQGIGLKPLWPEVQAAIAWQGARRDPESGAVYEPSADTARKFFERAVMASLYDGVDSEFVGNVTEMITLANTPELHEERKGNIAAVVIHLANNMELLRGDTGLLADALKEAYEQEAPDIDFALWLRRKWASLKKKQGSSEESVFNIRDELKILGVQYGDSIVEDLRSQFDKIARNNDGGHDKAHGRRR